MQLRLTDLRPGTARPPFEPCFTWIGGRGRPARAAAERRHQQRAHQDAWLLRRPAASGPVRPPLRPRHDFAVRRRVVGHRRAHLASSAAAGPNAGHARASPAHGGTAAALGAALRPLGEIAASEPRSPASGRPHRAVPARSESRATAAATRPRLAASLQPGPARAPTATLLDPAVGPETGRPVTIVIRARSVGEAEERPRGR